MKRIKVFLIPFLFFCFSIFPQQQVLEDKTETDTRLDYIMEKIEKMEKEIEEIKSGIEKLKEFDENIRKTIRNLELYVKPASSLPPTEEEWKSIKTGMSKKEVEEILGLPEEIEKKRTGEEIWYYFGRGSIKFDENGLVIQVNESKDFPPYFPPSFYRKRR